MCNLDNYIFDKYPELKPNLYVRYVDDICIVANKFNIVTQLKEIFEQHSVLKFTFETESKKNMPFLDVLINRSDNKFKTSVYVKKHQQW
jgi:hypothetical protein